MKAVATTRLRCAACGAAPADDDPFPFRCPRAGTDGADHVLERLVDPALARFESGDSANPFVRHRELLHSYGRARARGMSDQAFVALVEELDAAIARVDGRGFHETPLRRSPVLGEALGAEVREKDETRSVAGSHKARHLFGLALHLEVAERTALTTRAETDRRGLAIASCGNAALAAAVVARATNRPLRVFVPTDAHPAVLARLNELGAAVTVCPRQPGVPGDPCVHAFHGALAEGALPFCVQGNENGLAIEGGMTLGWELAAQLARSGESLDRLFVQVGGGALGSATWRALGEAKAAGVLARLPKLHAVQTESCRPLERAWESLRGGVSLALGGLHLAPGHESFADHAAAIAAAPDASAAIAGVLHEARAHRAAFMRPWEGVPHSVAHGILDDETYDWAVLAEGMLVSGGWPVAAPESVLLEARDLAQRAGVPADATGAAGLAGALVLAREGRLGPSERIGVLLTGVERAG